MIWACWDCLVLGYLVCVGLGLQWVDFGMLAGWFNLLCGVLVSVLRGLRDCAACGLLRLVW